MSSWGSQGSSQGQKQRLIAELKEKLAGLKEKKAEEMEAKAQEREDKANAAVAALESVANRAMQHNQLSPQLSKLAQIQEIEEGLYSGMPTKKAPSSAPPPTPHLLTEEELDQKKAAEQQILQNLLGGDTSGMIDESSGSKALGHLHGVEPTLAPTLAPTSVELGYKMKQEHSVAMQIAALNTPQLALQRELAREQGQVHLHPANSVVISKPTPKQHQFVSERFVPGGLAGLAMREEHTSKEHTSEEHTSPSPQITSARPVSQVQRTRSPASTPISLSVPTPHSTQRHERDEMRGMSASFGTRIGRFAEQHRQEEGHAEGRLQAEAGGRLQAEAGGRLQAKAANQLKPHRQEEVHAEGRLQAEARQKPKPTGTGVPTLQPTWARWKSEPVRTKHCKQIGIKGRWSDCSAVCGTGVKKRFYGQIRCVQKKEVKIETVQTHGCTGDFTGCATPIFTRIEIPPLRGFRSG
jgi:hypothetical protein